MGYDLHITRSDNWAESEETPISSAEWLAIVEADPELQLEPANGPYFAHWTGPCSYREGGWFDWNDGQIQTKNPDRAILAKMLAIAEKLGAAVQGDDGEPYSTPEDLPEIQPTGEKDQRPWWKFW